MEPVRILALGPDSSYYILFDNGSVAWSLPTPLHNKLNGRQNSLPPVSLLALGPSHEYFVQFKDCRSTWWGGDKEFSNSIRTHGVTVEHVVFGPNGGWFIIFSDGSLDWSNLPAGLANRLRGRQRTLPSVKQVALNDRGGYWVKFTDGSTWCSGGLDSNIWELLRKSPGRVVFGCEGDYYIWCQDGSSSWLVSSSRFDAAFGFINLDPNVIRFTHDSIGIMFKDYVNYTIHDLVDDLETDDVDVADIERIRVVNVDGSFWSLDNRRLWAFKNAGLKCVPVKIVEPDAQFYRNRQKIGVDGGWRIRVRERVSHRKGSSRAY